MISKSPKVGCNDCSVWINSIAVFEAAIGSTVMVELWHNPEGLWFGLWLAIFRNCLIYQPGRAVYRGQWPLLNTMECNQEP